MSSIRAFILEATELLRAAGVESPQRDAQLLMTKVLECRVEDLYLRDEQTLSATQEREWTNLLLHRRNRKPMSQILGRKSFYESEFLVNEFVLSPRPESEALVEKTLEWVRQKNLQSGRILDLGTGSGCLVISLAKVLGSSWDYVGVDKSGAALEVVKENAARLSCPQIEWREEDLMLGPSRKETWDILISNPPYIPDSERDALPPEVKNYEPEMALFGGEDGCAFYRKIFRDYYPRLKPQGLMMLETHNDGQREQLQMEWQALYRTRLEVLDCHLWVERKDF